MLIQFNFIFEKQCTCECMLQCTQKNYHGLIVFSTYQNFMHHGGNLENNFHWNFVIDDGLCPNLALSCETNAHMNDIII
jgi:hypothetical protein